MYVYVYDCLLYMPIAKFLNYTFFFADFSFRFRNNTPRVIGNRYEFEFSMGTSFLGATCQIERRSSDCELLMYM